MPNGNEAPRVAPAQADDTDGKANNRGAPHDAADAAGDAPGDSVTSDKPDGDSHDAWLPEDEPTAAEDRLFDWSDARFNRRRELARLLHKT